jgi:hypothetical protein
MRLKGVTALNVNIIAFRDAMPFWSGKMSSNLSQKSTDSTFRAEYVLKYPPHGKYPCKIWGSESGE